MLCISFGCCCAPSGCNYSGRETGGVVTAFLRPRLTKLRPFWMLICACRAQVSLANNILFRISSRRNLSLRKGKIIPGKK